MGEKRGKTAIRKGISGEGNRPWVAVWIVLMERAQERAGIAGERRAVQKAALGNFLLEFHRHPGRITAWEIRDYLFRTGEIGGRPAGTSPRSLEASSEAITFFYEGVLDRPALAEAARRPFAADKDGDAFGDQALLNLLRENLVENGAAGYVLFAGDGNDWSSA